MTFETRAQVRFADVDPAGIVFYPRYFEMLNGAVEDWFADRLGLPFAIMHRERHMGVPTVSLAVTFLHPSILGEDLSIVLNPREIGKSSCTPNVPTFVSRNVTSANQASARGSRRASGRTAARRALEC